jgi:hypothetical protein
VRQWLESGELKRRCNQREKSGGRDGSDQQST